MLTLDQLGRRTGRYSCPDVEGDLEARLHLYREKPAQEYLDEQGRHYIIEYLKTCPIDTKLLPQLAEFAANTRRLSAFYGAIMVINKWTGSDIDPYDQGSFRNWWAAHKANYEK